MKYDANDSRLTAYALGELDPEESREIEELLAHDQEARREVLEIREAAEWLSQEMEAEQAPLLTAEAREGILREASRAAASRFRIPFPAGLSAAAGVLVVLAVSLFWGARIIDRFAPENPLNDAAMSELLNPPTSGRQEGGKAAEAVPAATEEALRKAPDSPILADRARVLRERSQPDATANAIASEPLGYPLPPAVANAQPAPKLAPAAPPSPKPERPINGRNAIRLETDADQYRIQVRRNSEATLAQTLLTEALPSRFHDPSVSSADARSKRDDAPSVSLPRPAPPPDFNAEAYGHIQDNPFLAVTQNPLSTFSIDVDTASYANIRRFLRQGALPPKDAVRIEEMINYFSYEYPQPRGDHPFAVHLEMADAPWNSSHRLLRVGLKGQEVPSQSRPASNLVFLIDVSGSMQSADKLPLLKQGMELLTRNLNGRDRVAIAVYAGAAGLVLPSTSCDQQEVILAALGRLQAGGSTNGAAGIRLAYETAFQHRIEGGINRVILATDGDFNVGVSSEGELVRLIEQYRQSGVFLSVLGFGTGNLKDSMLEQLADKGNGNYAYVDTLQEARKVLVEQMAGTLFTIAKDVKIQIEFNPAKVGAYRLIGYENRLLRSEDFNDDAKDAGEIGAGHSVTALYELIPAGLENQLPTVDPLKYQTPPAQAASNSEEWLTVKLRYKRPEEDVSRLIERPLRDSQSSYRHSSSDLQFAAAVAAYGMILRDSPHKGGSSLDMVVELATAGLGSDPSGYRAEFLSLVKGSRPLFE